MFVFSLTFQSVVDFIRERFWLNSLIQLSILAALSYLAYRILMSKLGKQIRRKLPWLGKHHGERHIKDLIDAGEYARAGDALVQLGQLTQAVEVFQRGNLFGRAADVYLQRGQKDKAALLYQRAGENERAAEIFVEIGNFDQAEKSLESVDKLGALGQLYEKAGKTDLAGSVFEKSGDFEKASLAYLNSGQKPEAVTALLKGFTQAKSQGRGITGEYIHPKATHWARKAAQILEELGENLQAAELYLETGDSKAAARCYVQMGDPEKAAELFESSGDLNAAADVFEKSNEPQKAASIRGEQSLQSGDVAEAVKFYQKAQDFFRAAELYRDLQEFEKAAEMYEKADELALAGSLHRQGGNYKKAAIAYEKASAWKEAIDCYGLAKMPAEQAALMDKVGDHLGVSQNYYDRGLLGEALDNLAGIVESDADYRKALALKGQIFLDQGDPLQARKFLEASVKMAPEIGEDDLNTIYNLGLVENETQSESSALSYLERMMAKNLVDPEAKARAESVRKLLSERAFTRMSRVLSNVGTFSGSQEEIDKNQLSNNIVRRYKKIKQIGRGGMGIVYTARDTVLDRIVALKILPSSFKKNEQAVQTFLREAKAAASLNHPNIVTVHDAGTQEGDYYIAMEFIEGKTIKELLRKHKKLSIESVNEVLSQLLEALRYAHSRNVVHRDLTTNNLMWTTRKSVKIMDFGLAKIIKELMSEQSIIGGTPSYMSPEQALGDPIDHRTDIYTLGVCLYEMCLGELPFRKGDMSYHHVHTLPPIPAEKDPDLPPILNQIILRCLEKDSKNRFQRIQDIQEVFEKSK